MIKNLEAQKEKLKAELSKTIDEYYEEFSNRSNQPDFKIDQIEQLMLEQQKKVRESLNTSNGELTSSIETEEKKTVPNVRPILDVPKKVKK